MAYKSITKRWMSHSLVVILLVLSIITVILSIAIYQYYYETVERTLEMRAQTLVEKVQEMSLNPNLDISQEIRRMVQTFPQKDAIEMMAISLQGTVVAMSSGFSDVAKNDLMPDFLQAKSSVHAYGLSVYRMSETKEKVMAYSILLPVLSSDLLAVRYVVSMEEVERVIWFFLVLLWSVIFIIIGFIFATSGYFIRSIVIPVQEINAVARGFAQGDMGARIIKKSDDEIGQLCDNINVMADAIQTSEKVKNEFISSVSHELRTPLTAIKGWGETLSTMGELDAELLQKGMYVIVRETERLSHMVEELLDFSRMKSGKLLLTLSSLDILSELQDAVLIYAERARRDEIYFQAHLPHELPNIYGDSNRIRQVLINVIDNAIKYSQSGDCVEVTASVLNDEWIEIKIKDTGCGIELKHLSKVKEKFYKANSSVRGSGIGLAVADEIIALHEGKLMIESQPGEGTCVRIQLKSFFPE